MLSLGIDIGGTFTDVVVLDPRDGRAVIWKESTTPDDPARGAMTGTLAVAAAIVLLVSRHQLSTVEVKYPQAAATRAPLSHPSDALIGALSRGPSGDAANRIDEIFADRLDGYRQRRLSRRHEPEVKP